MALFKTLEEFIDQILFDYFLTKKQQEEIMSEVFKELNKADSLHDKFFHTNFPFL